MEKVVVEVKRVCRPSRLNPIRALTVEDRIKVLTGLFRPMNHHAVAMGYDLGAVAEGMAGSKSLSFWQYCLGQKLSRRLRHKPT
jgi:hypothetical protein